MTSGTVFFSRCKPQGADAADIAVGERRVFIGWPAWRAGVTADRHRLSESLVDPSGSEEDWNACYTDWGPERRHYQGNRNFIAKIQPGAIALVPRPERGCVYAGRVTAPFEMVYDPPWADAYLALRVKQGLKSDDTAGLVADVVQCCTVDKLQKLPFPLLPAYVRRSLLGRSTQGLVKPMPEHGLDPYPILDALISDPRRAIRPWTMDSAEVRHRLIDMVGPSTFEHLCVALLQLEHPEHVWSHVGGSGDGGVDGIGADEDGQVVGILQCKWAWWGDPVFGPAQTDQPDVRRILACLLHNQGAREQPGVELWDRSRIAALVIEHADRLPLALTLRVGAIVPRTLNRVVACAQALSRKLVEGQAGSTVDGFLADRAREAEAE